MSTIGTGSAIGRRASSVPIGEFVAAVQKAAREGKTNAEAAESLGMQPTSFSVRLSGLRKELKNDHGLTDSQIDAKVPQLKRSKQDTKSAKQAFLEELAESAKSPATVVANASGQEDTVMNVTGSTVTVNVTPSEAQ